MIAGALAVACTGSAAAPAKKPAKETPHVSNAPVCKSGADLAHHDGERVILVGTYRKRGVPKKMSSKDLTYTGAVEILLTGKATDYNPSAWDGAEAVVSLGPDPRPADELARWTDKQMQIEGRLVLKPPGEPNVAAPKLPPTLYDLSAISAP